MKGFSMFIKSGQKKKKKVAKNDGVIGMERYCWVRRVGYINRYLCTGIHTHVDVFQNPCSGIWVQDELFLPK